MRASLLIAAHNEGDALWKTIRACVETIYDVSYEIVVADDASNDGSIENAVRRFPQIRVVSQPERLGASPTKHAAALEAEGDVLVFLDGHTNPEFGAIKRLIQGVEELNGQAILTPAVPYLDTTNWLNSRAQVGHGYSFKLDTLSCNWLSLKELPVREMGRRQFRESPALIGCALAVTGTSADVDRIKYGYDRASNRIWRQNPVATAAGAQFDEFYTNDGLQRLKDMQRGTLNSTNTAITVPTFEQCWTLDPTGNWLGFHEATLGGWPLDQSRTANTVNEITGITNTTGGSWATPTYDAAGNMTTIPRVSAPVGPLNWATLTSTDWSNLTTDQWSSMDVGPSSSGTGNAFTATYDAWNRLITIADASTGQTVQQNQYDARTFRTVILSYTAGVLLETRHSYFSSEWRCIEERVGTATTAERQFVWGVRYIDDLILRDRGTERMYTLQDTNWNVTSIAASSGAIQERYAYSAYGTPNFLTSTFGVSVVTSFNWETLFCGYRYDGSVHLFQVRFRAYNAWLGCWCKRDPIGYVDGASLYEYARSIPLNAVDAMGLEVYICFRAFQDQDNKPYFRKNSRITGCPIAHVFLSVVDESGKTTTYSFHPDEFTATPNKRRRGRVWKNDPRDVRCSAGVGGDYECFEISKLKGQERRFLADVEKSISEVGVGREEGAGIPKTEQTESHKDPAPGCSMDYWVLGQNCAWWSTTTLVDVGQISPRDIGAERFRERKTGNPWNNGYGVYSFADPQGEGGMNGKPNTPRTFLTQPGCFKSDITGPIK